MEIKDITDKLETTNTETREQEFQIELAKAQVNAIGVLVGALGNIETQLVKLNHNYETILRYGLDLKQK